MKIIKRVKHSNCNRSFTNNPINFTFIQIKFIMRNAQDFAQITALLKTLTLINLLDSRLTIFKTVTFLYPTVDIYRMLSLANKFVL